MFQATQILVPYRIIDVAYDFKLEKIKKNVIDIITEERLHNVK